MGYSTEVLNEKSIKLIFLDDKYDLPEIHNLKVLLYCVYNQMWYFETYLQTYCEETVIYLDIILAFVYFVPVYFEPLSDKKYMLEAISCLWKRLLHVYWMTKYPKKLNLKIHLKWMVY